MIFRRTAMLMFLGASLAGPALSATPADTARTYVAAHRKAIVEEFLKLAGEQMLECASSLTSA